jgi:hypothetical protein
LGKRERAVRLAGRRARLGCVRDPNRTYPWGRVHFTLGLVGYGSASAYTSLTKVRCATCLQQPTLHERVMVRLCRLGGGERRGICRREKRNGDRSNRIGVQHRTLIDYQVGT